FFRPGVRGGDGIVRPRAQSLIGVPNSGTVPGCWVAERLAPRIADMPALRPREYEVSRLEQVLLVQALPVPPSQRAEGIRARSLGYQRDAVESLRGGADEIGGRHSGAGRIGMAAQIDPVGGG